MSLAVNDTLGPYRIVSTIGAGGMGEVYKAHDTRLDRLVAIKVNKEQFTARFVREARAIAALNHPNICTLHDVGPNYLVMEYVEGKTLKGPLPVAKVLEYTSQICDALEAAHRKGIIHRDLKPSNILITRRGVKLVDFGLARIVSGNDTATLSGAVLGTPGYMAPEQWQGKEADARTDIFSLGCVIYELITGERSQTRTVEPPALQRVIQTCVEADPEERWQSAREVKLALEIAGQTTSTRTSVFRRWVLTAAALALGLAAFAGWTMLHQPAPEVQSFRLSLNPPTGAAFSEFGMAISPDGARVAFIGGGTQSVWVQELNSSRARMLSGTEGAYYPFWSADGKSLGFFAAGKLRRISASGDAPRVIADAPSGRGGAWNSEGVIVFSPSFNAGLFRVPASGGQPTRLSSPDPALQDNSHRWPQFLPDGRRFVFQVQSHDPKVSGTYLSSLAKPSERVRISEIVSRAEYAPPFRGAAGFLVGLRNETLMAQPLDRQSLHAQGEAIPIGEASGAAFVGYAPFSVSANGVLLYGPGSLNRRRIEWRGRSGQLIRTEGGADVYNTPRLSRDGRWLALTRADSDGNNDLFLYQFGRGVLRRLTFGPLYDGFAAWSPDGRQIVLAAGVGGVVNIHLRDIAGEGQQKRLTQSVNGQLVDDWSSDGRYIVYTEVHPTTLGDLWVIPMSNAPESDSLRYDKAPLLATAFNETHGQFSPDGKWIAYTSNESGREEVYVQRFRSGGEKSVVSIEGGDYARWRRDGRELFYVSPDGRLMVVAVKPDGERLALSRAAELFRIPVRLGLVGYDYDVTPDGQQFLVLAPTHEAISQALTVVTDWQTAGKK